MPRDDARGICAQDKTAGPTVVQKFLTNLDK